MLQLVNLRMTQPRVDAGAFAAAVGGLRVLASDPNRAPRAAQARGLDQLHFGDAPRERSFPTSTDLASVNASRMLDVYKSRFSDASNFVFTITGTFDADAAISLVQSYLGTLPSAGAASAWTDDRPDPPTMPNRLVVTSGHGAKGFVEVLYDVHVPYDPTTRARAEVLEQLLQERLLDTVRKGLSASYSPHVAVTPRDRPNEGIETSVSVDLDAVRADDVVNAIDGIVNDLVQNGPTADEMQSALAQLVRRESYVSNFSISEVWLTNLTRSGGDVRQEYEKFSALEATTAADVTALAGQIWPADHRLELRVVPNP
jgi:zinc protease